MLCRVRKGGDNVCIRKTSTKLIRTPLVPRWPKSTMRICACAYEEWEIDTSLRRTGADSDGCGVRSCPWLQDWPKNRSSRKLALSGGSRLWLVVVELGNEREASHYPFSFSPFAETNAIQGDCLAVTILRGRHLKGLGNRRDPVCNGSN